MTNGRHQPPERDHDGRSRMRRAAINPPRRMLLAAVAVGLCAVATGVSLAAFSSPGGQVGHAADGANGSPAAGAQQPTPPIASSTTGPNVTRAGLAKTALQYPPALKGQMVHWTVGRGGAAWSAVTAQLGDVSQIGGMGLYSQLRLDCTKLGSSLRAARSAPPIPDKVMQRSYAKVLAGLSVTTAECRSAISVRQEGDEGQRIQVNKALLNRALAQFVTESKELYTATAEIRTLRR